MFELREMGFQQFLTSPPSGALYPRLEGFCIIIVLAGGRCSLSSKWCRYGVVGGWGGGVGGGIRAETTFSHCRLHPLLTTKVIEIAFAKRVFSLINRTVAFLQIYFPIFLKKLVEEFLTNTDSSQQAGNACPCARCCEY